MQSSIKIIKPVISEKSFSLASQGVYTFITTRNCGKKQIKNEINKLFKVDVISVNIVNIPGKVKRVGKKYGKRVDIKKALVKVKPGQKISIFETDDQKNENKSSKKKKDAVNTAVNTNEKKKRR